MLWGSAAVQGGSAVPGAAVPTVVPAAVKRPVRCGGRAQCGYTWRSAAFRSACCHDARCAARCHGAQRNAQCDSAQHSAAQFGAGVVLPGTVPGSVPGSVPGAAAPFGAAQLGFVPG